MLKKSYCGLSLVAVKGIYICINRYTDEVKCAGSYEKCNGYFEDYVRRISERG